jgi:hypothetical protein
VFTKVEDQLGDNIESLPLGEFNVAIDDEYVDICENGDESPENYPIEAGGLPTMNPEKVKNS